MLRTQTSIQFFFRQELKQLIALGMATMAALAHAQSQLVNVAQAGLQVAPNGASYPAQMKEVADVEAVAIKRKPPSESASQQLAFQDFVYRNYGRWLPVYGLDAFSFEDQGFDSPVTITPSEKYEIGPGDEIRIKLTGAMELDATLIVDNTGYISLPKIGPILVAGVRRAELQARVSEAVGRLHTHFNLHASTGKLRTISLLVVGHSTRPGVYRVPATSSLINVLYISGGASPAGSLRDIRLMRGDKTAATLDFYEVITKGLTHGDALLRNGDVIHVPPAGPRVALLGASNQQGIFELTGKKTTLSDLIQIAGGSSSSTRLEKVVIDRIDRNRPESPRKVINLNAHGEDANFLLEDGDVVSLQEISERFENLVAVRGSVNQALRRPWFDGMRVTDLITSRSVLYSPETERARNDLARGEGRGNKSNKLRPGQFLLNGQELSAERLEMVVAAENINWSLATIERVNTVTGQTELVNFNLGRALARPKSADDPLMQSGDQIVVYSDRTMDLPEKLRHRYVKVEGEIGAPGMYQLANGETLQQLLLRAGGLTERSFPYGMQVTRRSLVAVQKAQMNKAAQLMDDMIAANTVDLVSSSGTMDQKSQVEAMMSEMRRRSESLRRQTPDGRISLSMPLLSSLEDIPDLQLEHGDSVRIPARPSHVAVMGAVNNQVTVLWDAQRDLRGYIAAAQPRTNADLSEVYVIRANGMAEKVSTGSLTRGTQSAYPGDTIFVPDEPLKMSFGAALVNGLKDWSQVIMQILVAAKVSKGL